MVSLATTQLYEGMNKNFKVKTTLWIFGSNPAGIYLFKLDNRKTRAMCEILKVQS